MRLENRTWIEACFHKKAMELPEDVLLSILENDCDRYNVLSLVCKTWRRLCDTDVFWSVKIAKDIGIDAKNISLTKGDNSASFKSFYREIVTRLPYYAKIAVHGPSESEQRVVNVFPTELCKILPHYLQNHRKSKVVFMDFASSDTKEAALNVISSALGVPKVNDLSEMEHEIDDFDVGDFSHSELVIALKNLHSQLLGWKSAEDEPLEEGGWLRDLLTLMLSHFGELVFVPAEDDVVAVPASVIAFADNLDHIPNIIRQSNIVTLIDLTEAP